jgi:CO/xanthine dehydrogenase Mo-binding subunit
VDDIRLPDAVHLGFVRSPWAHAAITGSNASLAGALRATEVFTAADADLKTFPPPPFIRADERMFRPPLTTDRVRFVGDIVAAVVACSREAAADAAELVVAPEQVRVVAPDVGGRFGGKGLAVEDVLVAWLARATGRPVRWTETRSENLVAMHHGRAQRVEFEIGGVAAGQASEKLVEVAKQLVADELEASVNDMVLDLERGRFHVTGAPSPAVTETSGPPNE